MSCEIVNRLVDSSSVASRGPMRIWRVNGFEDPHPPHRRQPPLPRNLRGYYDIGQHSVGRITDSSSQTAGLCTSGLYSCLAFVGRCHETGRTFLVHTPTNLSVGWLDGHLQWLAQGAKTRPTIRLYLFRGASYSPANAAFFEHDKFIARVRNELASFSAADVKLELPARLLESGAILVSKGPRPVITVPVLHSDLRPPQFVAPIIGQASFGLVIVSRRDWPSKDAMAATSVANYIACVFQSLEGSYPVWLQHDVDRYLPPPRMPDEARSLLRAFRLRKSDGDFVSQAMMISSGRLLPMTHEWMEVKMNLEGLVTMITTWCEVCGKHLGGSGLCGRCKGAAYCGAAHQKEDWQVHKSWCNEHRHS